MIKHKRRGVMPLRFSSEELHALLLTQVLIRLEPHLDRVKYLALQGNLRARNWSRLAEVAGSLDAVHPGVVSHYLQNQFVALLKKYPYTASEMPGFNPELAAWKKFQSAEHSCKRVNQKFRAMRNSWNRYAEHMSVMRSYISSVIGLSPNLDEVYEKCDFGPGASVGVSGDFTNFGRKISSPRWSVSPLALSFSTAALWKHEQLRTFLLGPEPVCYDFEKFKDIVKSRIEVVSHNKISFVPKTYKTFRSIASEPLLNGYVQKGLDVVLRKLLARVGLDLSDQSTNCRMARDGSLGGFNPYCTIDLSSASDSMSTEMVKNLIPEDWFTVLDCLRSHSYLYDGVKHRYHKFVSMGNGFCFPLQTLIFAAVCHAVCVMNGSPKDFRVYGDDIVLRQSDALLAIELLKFLGFKCNPEKTFLTGRFRESCGTDWYCGQDVRPVYLDFRLDTNVDLYKIHNATLRSYFTIDCFESVLGPLRSRCPESVRFLRPFHGNQDGAFTVSLDLAMHSKFVRWNRSSWAWSWKEVVSTPIRDRFDGIDPSVCNKLEYLAVLRASDSDHSLVSGFVPFLGDESLRPRNAMAEVSKRPLTVRRKTRASVRNRSYWGVEGSEPFIPEGALPGESPVV